MRQHGRVFRYAYLSSTTICMCDSEGIKIAMTTRSGSKRVLGTHMIKAIRTIFGELSLSGCSGAEHSRLKKMLHPSFSVSAHFKLDSVLYTRVQFVGCKKLEVHRFVAVLL
jgi:cytochrome P450